MITLFDKVTMVVIDVITREPFYCHCYGYKFNKFLSFEYVREIRKYIHQLKVKMSEKPVKVKKR